MIVAGMAIGALSGFLTSAILRTRPRRLMRNATIGSAALVGGLFGCSLVPYDNTISYTISSGVTVSSTDNHYQHPWRIALLLAVALPLIHEVHRSVRGRRMTASG
jgi:MFS family permease